MEKLFPLNWPNQTENVSKVIDATQMVEVIIVPRIFIVTEMVASFINRNFIFAPKINQKFQSDSDVTRCGAIMCSLGGNGYYPSAFYTSKKGLCAFNKIYPIKSLEAFYDAIQFVISKCFSC